MKRLKRQDPEFARLLGYPEDQWFEVKTEAEKQLEAEAKLRADSELRAYLRTLPASELLDYEKEFIQMTDTEFQESEMLWDQQEGGVYESNS